MEKQKPATLRRAIYRFSVRDLLWLMLAVALAVGWWIDRRHVIAEADARVAKVEGELESQRLAMMQYQRIISSDQLRGLAQESSPLKEPDTIDNMPIMRPQTKQSIPNLSNGSKEK